MRITLSNLGPISSYEFDLSKSFHLIVGDNNVGKSYSMTAVYITIKTLLASEDRSRYLALFLDDFLDSSGDEALKLADIDKDVDITEKFKSDLRGLLNEAFIPDYIEGLTGAFGDLSELSNVHTGKPFQVHVESRSVSFSVEYSEGSLYLKDVGVDKNLILRTVLTNRKVKYREQDILVYHNKDQSSHFRKNYRGLLARAYSSLVAETLFSVRTIHYLPASRSGLYQALTTFGGIMAELSKSRSFLRRKIEIPGIPEHLSDYFIKITEITKNKRRFDPNNIAAVASQMEETILRGSVDFDTADKRITYQPQGTDLLLDLSSTSSMVSELAPVVTYLRYVLTERQRQTRIVKRTSRKGKAAANENPSMVIIEEPEAHLHPKVQLRLTEIFVELARRGVKVVMTSHSNYVFNKLNNLISKEMLAPSEVKASLFTASDDGAAIEELPVDELGVVDENFAAVTDELLAEKEAAFYGEGTG